MQTVTRRDFIKQTGALGVSTMIAGSFPRLAKAAKPIKFSGWTFKPDAVKDYVNFYNKTYKAQVQYEPIPWPQYHPTMETRAFAGEVVVVNLAERGSIPNQRFQRTRLRRAAEARRYAEYLAEVIWGITW